MMPTPEWERIRARFHEALARGPEARAALLRDIAAADAGLAREVESLLAAHDAVGSGFLATPRDDRDSHDGGDDRDGRNSRSARELAPGDRLGVFEILAIAGRGGMGDVYKARDLRLDRIVALKVVRAGLEPDGREARAISRLTHPHICTLYDVGSAAPGPERPELPFLVMEFLEGRTLADRLKDGPLDPADALRHAIAIADALASAHAHGIVHRDLKPGNIMLTASGVKLLDFGLAQLRANGIGFDLDSGADTASAREMASHTSLSSLAARGLIAGTLRYMSPEQLRGESTDTRSDIFAFGVVLHEMLTGRPPFDATDDASVIAAVLAGTAPPIETAGSPHGRLLTPIVARCLEKARDRRWQRMDDVREALRAAQEGREHRSAQSQSAAAPVARVLTQARTSPRAIWRSLRLAIVAAIVACASIGVLLAARAFHPAPMPAAQSLTRVSILPPDGVRFDVIQISPDGRHIAFTGWSPQGTRIWLRALDADAAQPLPDTEEAQGPVFWSPDSRYLAFVSRGSLVAYDTVNRTTRVICLVRHVISGSWGSNGVILFDAIKSPENGLRRVSASGGASTLVRKPDDGDDDGCMFPHFLPDGQYLYSIRSRDPRRAGVFLTQLDAKKPPKRVLRMPSPVQYVQSGHLLFIRENMVMAQRFDPESGALDDEAVPIVRADTVTDARRRMATSMVTSGAGTFFSASQTGVLVHAANPIALDQLAWYDRNGRKQESVGDPAPYGGFALSPDGTRVVATRTSEPDQRWNLWMLDLARNVSSRLTFDGMQFDPRWSPDGRRIAVAALRPAVRDSEKALAAVGLDGRETLLYHDASGTASLDDWSPDGRTLLFHSDRRRELLAAPIDGKAAPSLIWQSPSASAPDQARFSPDGRWIAYHSQDSGRPEVYVTRFPAAGERWQVSNAGGVQPMWRGDGRELFYLGLDGRLFAVSMTPTSTASQATDIQPGAPQALFQTPIGPSVFTEQFAVDKTGTRFLLMEPDPRAPAPLIDLVMNWTAAFPPKPATLP